MSNQCSVYDETLTNLKNSHQTEKEFMNNLKNKIASIRDILKEETSQRDKLLDHAKLQRKLVKNLETQRDNTKVLYQKGLDTMNGGLNECIV
jgi:ABC-type uncharacterized transport system ATPase subunit